MKSLFLFLISAAVLHIALPAQKLTSRKGFFTGDSAIEATLQTNFSSLTSQKKDPVFQPAVLTWHHADSSGDVVEQIRVRLRGNFRKDQCSFASMMFNFRDSTKKSRLSNLKQLKIVVPCEWGSDDEQWVIREYLVYKIYQLFTPLSHRARLIRFRFEDNSGSMKPYRQYGFALEPIDDLAKRNKAKEVSEKEKIGSEATDRAHTTMVYIFQYMIGNTDWKIPVRHNIKMVALRDSAKAKAPPFIVPYDFDYCGAVNALYADPPPHIGIEKVTDRKYMGFPRTLAEIEAAMKPFYEKEQAIYDIITGHPLLKKGPREEMLAFIRSFYDEVRKPDNLQKLFVEGAVTK